MTPDEPLVELLLDRLAADGVADEITDVVLGAAGGDDELRAALDGRPTRPRPAGDARRRTHVYLEAITVTGFRGVGPQRTLPVRPGPGLTLVVGRNGSGKSSFAEAIELALTGDSARGADRAWRNVHQPDTCAVRLDLRIGDPAAPTRMQRSWAPGDDLGAATASVTGAPDELDLARLSRLYRPFLTPADLGRLATSTATALHDSTDAVLGLELLTDTDRRLTAAARPVDSALAEHRHRQAVLRAALGDVDDDRARRAAQQLAADSPDLDLLDSILAEPVDADTDKTIAMHHWLADLTLPEPAAVARLAADLARAVDDSRGYEQRQAKSSLRAAELFRLAIDYHAEAGDGPCPVCHTGTLDGLWRRKAEIAFRDLRELSLSANRAASQVNELTRRARQLIDQIESPAGEGSALALLRDVVAALHALPRTPGELAAHLSSHYPPVAQAADLVRRQSVAYLSRRDTAWQSIAGELRAWSADARRVPVLTGEQARIKAARQWLGQAADGIRDARLAPFAEQSQAIWTRLCQEGTSDAALGVLSQGELQALGLATFLPHSCAAESPFRFMVIDDPVQSMDSSKVDGLARVLAELAGERQVVVFTHDSRLPDAVHRLEIDLQVLEVVRAEQSVVTVRVVLDPAVPHLA
ncbi:AAA family ATPase [Catellatospora aurea]|uniref:Nuclease SbcCD subunit C n=1 Tax=Catellatospora aurea TaxID=1337874 RepID=A0ABW2HAB2_9ACTN